MAKLKLGIVADAGSPTGFSTVTHNIAWALQESGEYDIEILGINFDGKPNEWSKKLSMWPARLGGDFLGIGYVSQFYEEVKPDVLFLFQDFWNISQYLPRLPQNAPGVVAYYPVDAPNIKGQYMLGMGATTATACYTEFGVQESMRAAKEAWKTVQEQAAQSDLDLLNFITVEIGGMNDKVGDKVGGGQVIVPVKRLRQLCKPEGYTVIPHGVDVSIFHPVPTADAREKLKIQKDWFVVGNVNRNQSRKRQDLTIRAFAKFAEDKPDARLILHCVRNDPRGWDLHQLGVYYGVDDKIIMTHALFDGARATEEELNYIYNSFDVQINTCGGEGWGLTNFEGAACGTAQIVPDWSATKEIWEGTGLLIDVAEVRHEMSMINTMQAVIDSSHAASLLNELYEDRLKLAKVGADCLAVTQRPEYKWENVGKQFDKLFKASAGKPPKSGEVALTHDGVQKLKNAKKMQFS
ncbi:MAG: glycosyltransferase family 4 protein [Bacteroidales bacterium]|nr:glycosyltransferase family 4 protein [Candidatus Latescibacterota bacterium]